MFYEIKWNQEVATLITSPGCVYRNTNLETLQQIVLKLTHRTAVVFPVIYKLNEYIRDKRKFKSLFTV